MMPLIKARTSHSTGIRGVHETACASRHVARRGGCALVHAIGRVLPGVCARCLAFRLRRSKCLVTVRMLPLAVMRLVVLAVSHHQQSVVAVGHPLIPRGLYQFHQSHPHWVERREQAQCLPVHCHPIWWQRQRPQRQRLQRRPPPCMIPVVVPAPVRLAPQRWRAP